MLLRLLNANAVTLRLLLLGQLSSSNSPYNIEDIVPRRRRAQKTAKASEVVKEAKKLGEALGLRLLITYENIDVYVVELKEGIAEIVDQTILQAKLLTRAKSFQNELYKIATEEVKVQSKEYSAYRIRQIEEAL